MDRYGDRVGEELPGDGSLRTALVFFAVDGQRITGSA
jgi:hypothetical protein